MNEILTAALDYRRRGLSVIPLGPDKKPALRWKRYQTAPADEQAIRRWYATENRGVAAIFGSVSDGLVSRDFDDMETYDAWAHTHPELAESLPTSVTRRGRHVFGKVDLASEQAFRERIGKPKGRGAIKCRGGELRIGAGCYSVLPPSVHPTGHVYKWTNRCDTFPRLNLFESGFMTFESAEVEQSGGGVLELEVETGTDLEALHTILNTSSSSPCLEYSLDSLDSLLHQTVQLIIERTIPTTTSKRHDCIFKFCRELWSLPEFHEASPKSMRQFVREWHRRANCFYKADWEETWLDFLEGWANVKYRIGEEPFSMLFNQVAKLPPPPEAAKFDSPNVKLLVALCRELQLVSGKGPFYISTRAAGRLFDVTHVQVSRWLRLLRQENVLRLVSKGTVESGQASRYYYLGLM